ncbi:MAG: ferredoxin [Phycisphaerae bacterium]|nr:ferredoxin [Phycisphaerae bacterium]
MIRVWIETGCIVCDACASVAPDVFDVREDGCVIRAEAHSEAFLAPRSQAISDAAIECPVEVISIEQAAE